MQNRIFNGLAVGINPASAEWTMLAKYMQEAGSKQTFGDYASYDGSICPAVMYEVLECYERFYHNSTEEDRLIRAALFEECVNSRHVNSFGE